MFKKKKDDICEMIVQEIPHLRRYARSLLNHREGADDLVQDTLERGLSRQKDWRKKGTIRSWLFSIMYHQFLDSVRKDTGRGRYRTLSLDENVIEFNPEIPSHDPRQEKIAECKSTLSAVERLPYEQRQVLLLNAVEGLSYDEIATVTDVPIGTVRSRLARARERLHDLTGRKKKDVSQKTTIKRRIMKDA